MGALIPLNGQALDAWQELTEMTGSTVAPADADPFLVAYRTSKERQASSGKSSTSMRPARK